MKLFNGPVWGAWLGLLLMLIGFLLTLPVEGGRMTFRFLGTAIGSSVILYLRTLPWFPYSTAIQIALLVMVMACIAASIWDSKGFGVASAIGELILGYGTLLVFRSLIAAFITLLVLVLVHLIRNR